MIPLLGNPGFVWFSTCILPDQSASFKRRWTSTWPTLRESTALHFIRKGIATKSNKQFIHPLSWTTNEGKWREWSKIIEGNGQRPSSWICFCLDLGHHKEFLAERGINGAIFAVHQFLRLKRSAETLVLCESIIIHHPSSIINLKHPQALPSGPMQKTSKDHELALKLSLCTVAEGISKLPANMPIAELDSRMFCSRTDS